MVSIVVLAHNRASFTSACLRSVLATRPQNSEILVVDNGSTDETPQVLEDVSHEAAARGTPMQIIAPGRNLGCCVARNRAVAQASGEDVLFLDNDTVVPDPAWLEKLAAVLHTDSRIAVVGPRLCYPFDPHLIQCAGVAVSRTGRLQFRGRGEPSDDPRFSRQEDVQALLSACFMFPKRLYGEVGGLDESLSTVQYYEDLDFCYRCRSRGYRVVYTPDPVVHHWEGMTAPGRVSPRNRYFIIKHGMTFKKRWRHMFEKENGPEDAETGLKAIAVPRPPSRQGETRRDQGHH